MDMESSAYTDATLDIFETVQRECGNTGLAIQAYLYRTEKDLRRLAPLKPKMRLVKGAYREPKKIALQDKPAVDANFKRVTTLLLEGAAKEFSCRPSPRTTRSWSRTRKRKSRA